MKKALQEMISSEKTIFSVNMLGKYFNESNDIALRKKISYYIKIWYLERLTKGLYSISWAKVNAKELANKMYSPSYISFETALYHHGLIFQANPSQVDLAYKKSDMRTLEKINLTIRLRSLKASILLSPEWLTHVNNFTIASAERAFLDTIYLHKNYYFDNLDILNIQKMKKLLTVYWRDKLMTKRVKSYFPNF